MFVGLSSTIRIVAISGSYEMAGHRSPHLADEQGAVEVGLSHDGADAAIELRPLLRRDRGGRDDDHRDLLRLRKSVQRLHDIETVDVGHHEVEHDQVGYLAARDLDGLATA